MNCVDTGRFDSKRRRCQEPIFVWLTRSATAAVNAWRLDFAMINTYALKLMAFVPDTLSAPVIRCFSVDNIL